MNGKVLGTVATVLSALVSGGGVWALMRGSVEQRVEEDVTGALKLQSVQEEVQDLTGRRWEDRIDLGAKIDALAGEVRAVGDEVEGVRFALDEEIDALRLDVELLKQAKGGGQ